MSGLPPAPWGKPWFHPKSFGYGAGLPCSWEGWAVLGGFFAALLGWSLAVRLLVGRDEALGSLLTVIGSFTLAGVLIVIAWGRTSDGWRWR